MVGFETRLAVGVVGYFDLQCRFSLVLLHSKRTIKVRPEGRNFATFDIYVGRVGSSLWHVFLFLAVVGSLDGWGSRPGSQSAEEGWQVTVRG